MKQVKLDRQPTEKSKAKSESQVEKVRAKAIKELTKSKSGFAVFYITTDKKGKSTGLAHVVGGYMALDDTMLLAEAMHDMSENMVEGMVGEMRKQNEREG